MMINKRRLLLPLSLLFCGSAALAPAQSPTGPRNSSAGSEQQTLGPRGKKQTGIASLYTDQKTSSGERFSAKALTAAHPTLPLGTRVLVTCLRSGRSTIVRINDRGPFIRGRIIDLTPAAAANIGLTKARGIARVELQPLG